MIGSIGWPISCGSRWPRSARRARRHRRRQDVVYDVLAGAVSRGIAEGDLRGDIDADKVARTLWSFTIGNRILSVALDQDIFAGLGSVWELLLRAIATPESEPYFQQFAARMAQQDSSRRGLSGWRIRSPRGVRTKPASISASAVARRSPCAAASSTRHTVELLDEDAAHPPGADQPGQRAGRGLLRLGVGAEVQ